jgi:hypothetical protein
LTKKHAKKYVAFRKLLKTTKRKIYLRVYKDYLKELKTEYINERIYPLLDIKEKKYLTLDETRKYINTERNVVKNLSKHGLVKTHTTNVSGRNIILVEKSSVDEYIAKKEQVISLKQVTKELGINYKSGLELIGNGLLKPINGPDFDGYYFWYFLKDDFNEIIKHIYSLCKKRKGEESDYIPFPKAYDEQLMPLGLSKGKLLFKFIKGEITGFCLLTRQKKGLLNNIYINQQEIDKFLVRLKNPTS